MFDSQFCSLVTITCLVQLLGLLTVISYRLRATGRFNQAGLVIGLLVMAASTFACLCVNPGAGILQGVCLVFVAACTSLQNASLESSPF